MAVYVDPLMPTTPSKKWPFRASCHLYADDEEELHRFARRLGLKRSWFQSKKATGLAHYDLVDTKRRLAVKLGALPQTISEAGTFFMAVRKGHVKG